VSIQYGGAGRKIRALEEEISVTEKGRHPLHRKCKRPSCGRKGREKEFKNAPGTLTEESHLLESRTKRGNGELSGR